MVADNEKDEYEEKEKKGCCSKFLKFLFSHIGLSALVVGYSIGGGFIFQYLEQTNEQDQCFNAEKKYDPMENDTVYKIWDIGVTNCVDKDDDEVADNAVKEISKLLVKFRDDSLELGYDGKNCTAMGEEGGPEYDWNFSGSLLFAVTIITTIGYGNISPLTSWGRIVCIAYATLGIPLMLLCLAQLGDVMADIFRYVYATVCCCGCCRRKREKKERDRTPTPEAWKANYGNSDGPVIVEDSDSEDEDDDEFDEDHINVPLSITVSVIALYIIFGAVMFEAWEDWSLMDSCYFCFVTVSTIGFGDMVPGTTDIDTAEEKIQMAITAIYMLFGLALLSMCFALIQEEIAVKFKFIGDKIAEMKRKRDEKKRAEQEMNPETKEQVDMTSIKGDSDDEDMKKSKSDEKF